MKFKYRNCPVCNETYRTASLFQKENISASKFNSFSYSSRKNPEFMCHEMVRCKKCDLVYVSKPPDIDKLEMAYHDANFDSATEAHDAAATYCANIQSTLKEIGLNAKILEIGSGSGDFLLSLKNIGYKNIVGIEPSLAAIDAANKDIKKNLIHGVFNKNNFDSSQFDLICCFMTLEHVFDPKIIVDDVFYLLKKDGFFIAVAHNYSSWINKILGKKSPIIDIEHMQIFSKKSVSYLMKDAGYRDIQINTFKNKYSLIYWIRLLPLPNKIKIYMIKNLKKIKLSNFKISMNVGNMIVSGKKKN
jgi:SAM-dependent methyltransferase